MNKETKPQEVSFFGKLWQKILALFPNFKKNSKPEITVDLINLNNSSPSINQTETSEIKYLTHQTEPSLEHLKSSNKLSFAQNLNKDFLLLGIAIGCVLGVIYFIFGGLQPVLLKGYIKNTMQNLAAINQTFINQTNSLILFNTNLLNATTYNLLADCSPEQKYQTLTQDLEKLENLERALLPNQQLQEPSKFNGFKDREVYLRYQQYYQFYQAKLTKSKRISVRR